MSITSLKQKPKPAQMKSEEPDTKEENVEQ